MTTNQYYIDSFIRKASSGIISVTINATESGLQFHAYNNNEYVIGRYLDMHWDNRITIDVESSMEKDMRYLRVAEQEKEQTTFYYIPFSLLV